MLKDNVDRLLDADVSDGWPNDGTISKWFFKPKSDEHMDQYVEPGDEALHGDVHLSALVDHFRDNWRLVLRQAEKCQV